MRLYHEARPVIKGDSHTFLHFYNHIDTLTLSTQNNIRD
jgi:hypothetical protein